jgi:hypothetical protein
MGQRKGLYYEVLNREIFDSIVNQDEVETIEVQHDVRSQSQWVL